MSVKLCCAAILVLAVFLTTSTQAQASGGCQEAQVEVMGCVQNYQVDYQRLQDAAYIPELCRQTLTMGNCLKAVQAKCPSLPFLQGPEATSMNQMMSQLQTMCPPEPSGESSGGPSGECGAAQVEVMGCVQNYDLDFKRLEDPAYIPELCRAIVGMDTCLKSAQEKCPSLPFLQGPEAESMTQMLTQFQSMCPQGGAPTACPNPMQEMAKCSEIMDSFSANGPGSAGPPCEKMEEAVLCMSRFQQDCGDHPMIAGQDLTGSIQQIRNMMAMSCGEPIIVTEGEEEEEEEEEETENPETCDSPTPGVMTCNEILQGAIRENECWTAQQFTTCLTNVQQICSAHPDIDSFDIPATIASINGLLTGLCDAPGPDTVIDVDVDEDVDEAQEVTSRPKRKCPKNESKFFHKVSRCQRPMNDSTLNQQQMCKATSKAKKCVRRLYKACENRSWMSGQLEQTMENSLRGLRQTEKQIC